MVHARLTAPGGGYGDDDEDVGFADTALARVEQLQQLITDVGGSVLRAAAAAGPDEASVSFGVELTAKSGAALAVLASGEAKTSVQVTLLWRLKEQPGQPGQAGQAGQAGEAARTSAAPAPVPVPPDPDPAPPAAPAAVPAAPAFAPAPPAVTVPPPPAHPPAPVRPPAAPDPAAAADLPAADRDTGGDGTGGSGTAPA